MRSSQARRRPACWALGCGGLLLLPLLLWLLAGCERSTVVSEGGSAASSQIAASARAAPAAVARVRPSSQARAANSAAPKASSRGLFYKVQSATATAYLLGSIHVGRRHDYPLHPRIETAFDQADRLVLEVVLDDRARREVASKFAQAGSYPPQDSLARHLSPALLQAVNARAAQTKLPPAALQRMRPWFLATMFTVSELGRLGYDPEQGIDRYFQRRAARSKKQTLSLETVEQQIALFQGLSPEVEQLMLRETLEELPRLNEVMQGALQAWEKGDAPGLQRMLLETMDKPQYRKLRRRLFDDRNLAMSAQIERYLKTDLEYFVVVGSGHVIGDRGIVELLRKKRCRVVQQ